MPYFIVSGLDNENVKEISKTTTDDLAKIIDCPNDWINFSKNSCKVFCEGKVSKEIFVHIEWFDRGGEVKEKVAKILMNNIQNQFGKDLNVTTVFVNIEKSNYYENGNNFK